MAKKYKYEGFNTAIRFRCDESIVQYVNQLAEAAERNPSEYLRDLIFLLRMTPAGILLSSQLLQDGIHYRPRIAVVEAPPLDEVGLPYTKLFDRKG